ncbi:hypothetical protein [Methanocella paludicola]|nr:hypothetical protein [Methanocella paludicola]
MVQILESAQVAIVGIASLYMMATNKSVRGYLDSLGSHNDSKKT